MLGNEPAQAVGVRRCCRCLDVGDKPRFVTRILASHDRHAADPWHTLEDRPNVLSRRSLDAAGEAVVELMRELRRL